MARERESERARERREKAGDGWTRTVLYTVYEAQNEDEQFVAPHSALSHLHGDVIGKQGRILPRDGRIEAFDVGEVPVAYRDLKRREGGDEREEGRGRIGWWGSCSL